VIFVVAELFRYEAEVLGRRLCGGPRVVQLYVKFDDISRRIGNDPKQTAKSRLHAGVTTARGPFLADLL